MESQPQNPEFRNNPKKFHPWYINDENIVICICKLWYISEENLVFCI